MKAYGALAAWYDGFTGDVPYAALADYYESLLLREGQARLTLLDLCCGTGTLTMLLARRGHELIGVDRSPEMLSVAAEKAAAMEGITPPLLLCQEASELDLYGTVQGAYCCLDGMNYLPPEDLPELFRRLHLFIEPGGRFVFDFHAPAHLRALDGEVFVDETEDHIHTGGLRAFGHGLPVAVPLPVQLQKCFRQPFGRQFRLRNDHRKALFFKGFRVQDLVSPAAFLRKRNQQVRLS